MFVFWYNNKTYEEEIRLTPSVDTVVKTSDGIGTVCETSPLTGMIKVKLNDSDGVPKPYHRDSVQVLGKSHSKKADNSAEEAEIEE